MDFKRGVLERAEKRPLHHVTLISDRDVCEDCDEHVYLFIALWWRAPRHPTLPCPVFFPYMRISAYTDFRFYGYRSSRKRGISSAMVFPFQPAWP